MKFEDIGSGVTLPSPVIFELLDYDNQVVNLNSEDQVSLFATSGSNATIKGVSSVNLNNGVATFDGIMFVDEPGHNNVSFYASTNAISEAQVLSAFPGEDFNNNLTVDFRYCQPGEQEGDQGT
jgi:hypothetical protein